ncbi:hypothetical protein Patl1_11677 [Pistacia atlantica]|uniref:Uncharacterized protein n=1 Tax=Pistacia atlantica TaxID=434234 RepID=A0ACC1A412_9ROSI|nr:hypothetical protein Patl1_11677 [Pistacia atlantica]
MHNEEEWKGTSAPDIDLSYNYLSGTFPSWVSTGSKQLYRPTNCLDVLEFLMSKQMSLGITIWRTIKILVANNFTFESSNISSLLGLNCLQRNFLCNKNAPRYSSFAIKCGGEEMKVDIIVCEADGYDLGGASCIVLDTAKLAISGAGPKLYQSSRQSSGSLRFYGLRLENGLHNVSLSFAETVFGDQGSQKWMSLGRRVFDIHIQLKDFDISTRAGGEGKAITNKFNANVSENYLEIHLLWAGKGTCCIADGGSYGSLISALKCHSW